MRRLIRSLNLSCSSKCHDKSSHVIATNPLCDLRVFGNAVVEHLFRDLIKGCRSDALPHEVAHFLVCLHMYETTFMQTGHATISTAFNTNPLFEDGQMRTMQSQIPSHASTRNSSSAVRVWLRTSGSAEMICALAGTLELPLYFKSPSARERLRLPLLRRQTCPLSQTFRTAGE